MLIPRIALLTPLILLVASGRLHAVTPGLQSAVTVQGVVTYTTYPTAPKTVSVANNTIEYKATQYAGRVTNRDIIQTVIGTDNITEVNKWKLVGVRSVDEYSANLDHRFYLVNVNKTVPPLVVPASVFSLSLYVTADSYTERWQGMAPHAPVSGGGKFKGMAGIMFALSDPAYPDFILETSPALYGLATGSYRVASNLFGGERLITYVPGAVKLSCTGMATLSDEVDTIYCLGEFKVSIAASKPVDLDLFPSP